MNPLLKAFIDICMFRNGPQELPSSNWLRNTSLLSYMLLGFLLSASIEPVGKALVSVLLDSLFVTLLAMVPLILMNRPERITQTLTAIYGSNALFCVAIGPLAAIYTLQGNQAGPILASAITALGLWNLAVLGNILRHAFNLPLIAGMAIAITYLAISSQFTQ